MDIAYNFQNVTNTVRETPMQIVGLEPTRYRYQQILSLPCLPIPPYLLLSHSPT